MVRLTGMAYIGMAAHIGMPGGGMILGTTRGITAGTDLGVGIIRYIRITALIEV